MIDTPRVLNETKKRSRPSMDETYLNVARCFAERSSCLRRGYGAVAVKNKEIIATGYNGGPRGGVNCCDIGNCKREELNIPPGERYELCRGIIHAEMNVCQQAKRSDLKGATLYLYGLEFKTGEPVERVKPCTMCDNFLRNAEFKDIVFYNPEGRIERQELKREDHWYFGKHEAN